MRSSQSRALFSFTFVSAGRGDAVSFNVPVYGSASAVVQEKRLTLDGSSAVSVWAAPVAVTAIARTVSGQLVAVEATVDRPTVAEVPSGGGGSGLPVPGSGDAGKVVTVTGGEDGFELDPPAGGASEGSHVAVPFNFATAEATLVAGHDAVFHINITGAPTGGTFQTAYNGSPLGDPLAFDCSVSDIQAVFDGGVGSGYVIGGANPNFTLDNTVSQDSPLADLLTFDVSGLTGGSSPDVTCTLITPFVHQVIGMIVYAPTVGEWLYDMWFELIDTFDGVNPNLDVCSAASLDEGSPTGLFDLNNRGAIDGTDAPDDTSQFNGGLANATNTFGPSYLRADGVLPARFVDSGPLYLACSDSGTPYGINPESTVGSGVLHLIVYPAAS